jgi:hypothetical protein
MKESCPWVEDIWSGVAYYRGADFQREHALDLILERAGSAETMIGSTSITPT